MLTLNVMLVELAGHSLLAHHRIVSDRGKHHHHQPEYPVDDVAPVSVSLRIDRERGDEDVVSHVRQIASVVSVRTVNA